MKRSHLVGALVFVAMSGDIEATAQQPRPGTILHRVQEHQMDVRQPREQRVEITPVPQDRVTPQFLHELLRESAEQPADGRRLTGVAWRLFTRGEYRRARDLFTALVADPDPEAKWDATYGLAMCYAKLKDKRAIPLLKELLDREEPMPKDRRAQLAIELHNLGEFAEAERYFVELLDRQ